MPKAFSLIDALAGKPVVTRSGHAIVRLAYFPEAEPYWRVVAYDGIRFLFCSEAGAYDSRMASGLDLFLS